MCTTFVIRSEMEIKQQFRINADLTELVNFFRQYIDQSEVNGTVQYNENTGYLFIRIEHKDAHIRTVHHLETKFSQFGHYVIAFARVFWRWAIWDGVLYIGQDAETMKKDDKRNPVKLGLLKAGFKRQEVKRILMDATDIEPVQLTSPTPIFYPLVSRSILHH